MKDVRLVLCDIDNTLVPTGCPLSDKTKEVIERLHAHGVLFGIASGRSLHQQLIGQAKKWGFDYQFDVLIGMNGSELWDNLTKTRVDTYRLSKEAIKTILDTMLPLGLNPFIYIDDVMMVLYEDEDMHKSSMRNRLDLRIAESVEDFYAQENAKIMFRMSEEKMPEVEAYAKAHPIEGVQFFKTQTTLLEFTDARVNKAVAMKNFCESHGISLDQVMTFGDLTNDSEMLKEAGWGVCLLNGDETTKACANDVTEKTCAEDGFALYLEKHVLEPCGW